jgi:O-antigen ligase
LTEGPDKASYLTNMAMCFLVAEGIQRLRRKPRMLPVNNGILLFSLAATLFSLYLEGGRMANLALAVMLMVAVIIFLRNRRRKGNRMVEVVGVICGIIFITAVGYNMRRDPRWKTFKETFPIAWNTEDHLAWLDWNKYPIPRLSNGQPVDHSNYMHVVWFKTGVQLALENPLGVGFNRNAYGHALQKKYGEGSGHAHYGFLDLAIGIGIPGLLLWLTFLATLFVSGLRGYRATRSYAALALVLVVTDYGVRMFLDSVVRDHMLEQFLFVLAILSTFIAWDLSKGVLE